MNLENEQQVLLNYFSMYLNNMTNLEPLWGRMKETFRDRKSCTFSFFYLFGATDVLLLGIGNENDLIKMKNMATTDENLQGVKDFFVHAGLIIDLYPNEFDFIDAVTENPVIGIVTVKIREEVLECIYRGYDNFEKMSQFLSKLFRDTINKTRKECAIGSSEYRVILLLSYEIEDAKLIFLTNSFQFVKKFAINLRSVQLKDIRVRKTANKLKIKHIIASTNTVLGINLLRENNRLYFRRINKNEFDRINWWTDFEVRPGHMRSAIETIEKAAKNSRNKLNICPIAGRNDITAYHHKNLQYSLQRFLKCHYSLFNTSLGNRYIISSETNICFPGIQKTECRERPNISISDPQIDSNFKNMLRDINVSKNLHLLERESLTNIVKKLQYLLNDTYLEGSFTSFVPLIKESIGNYLKIPVGDKLSEKTIDLEFLTSFIELSYIVRYQGLPPVGETAVCPTLGTYTMGQKLLPLLDYTGHYLLYNLAKKLGSHKFQPQTILTTSINPYIGTHIPCPSLNVAFIQLPVNPLIHHDIALLTFFHELGHSVYNSFCLATSLRNLDETVKRHLGKYAETFAEFYSCKVLSDLDFNRHEELNNRVLKQLEFRSESFEEVFRLKKKQIQKSQKTFQKGPSKVKTKVLKLVKSWMRSIGSYDDEILPKIRVLLNKDSSFIKEFWNLWIFLNNQRRNYLYCLYSFSFFNS